MTSHRLVLPFLLAWPAVAAAQESPQPAPELQKYAPLIGSWHGTGTAQMGPGEPSKWESRSTYSWALGGFFVQEDTVVTFADMAKPLIMRGYFGWDAENGRYVAAGADNDGHVGMHEVQFLGDGSMVRLVETFHEGQTFLERYTVKVDGDAMAFSIDMMAAAGPASAAVVGTMKRADKPVAVAANASSFTAAPAAPVAALARTAGTFAVEATMRMMPDAPPMQVSGTDVVTPLFGGTIVHVHTTGKAEGIPEEYVGELYYGYDEKRGCLHAVHVSNMGEIGEMSGGFTEDGRQLVLTAAQRFLGQPAVQRVVMHLDASGAPTKAVGHCLLGTAAPYESWDATYKKTN